MGGVAHWREIVVHGQIQRRIFRLYIQKKFNNDISQITILIACSYEVFFQV
jgi:hypothetical protein